MGDETGDRIARKLEVSFFVLNKKFKGLSRERLESEVKAHLATLLGPGWEGKARDLPDDDFVPVLNDAVEMARKSYVMTLPSKKKAKIA